MNPEYTICITHHNNGPTIRKSLDSILNQIDSRFEVVVVDSFSNDGSQEALKEYSTSGKIMLIRKQCSRGRGRQIALENSTGKYVIANLDFDDVFKPRLVELLEQYEKNCRNDHLWVRSLDTSGFWGEGSCKIAPRDLLLRLGGWRDLQFAEDWELARRSARTGNYKWTYFRLLESVSSHSERRSSVGMTRYRYVHYRDRLRCGLSIFEKDEPISFAQRLPYLLAKFSLPFYEHYYDSVLTHFNPFEPSNFVDFEESPNIQIADDSSSILEKNE